MFEGTILQYFPRPTTPRPGESLLDFATKGQIAIKPVYLPVSPPVVDSEFGALFSPVSVRIYEDDNIIEFFYDRDRDGANVSLHSSALVIPIDSLLQQIATPTSITQMSRYPLFYNSAFAGYTEHGYRFVNVKDGYDNRLDQNVEVLHIPHRVSPKVETVKIQRHVSDQYGIHTYATIFLQNEKEVLGKLGVPTSKNVFVAITPYGVYAITYGEQIIKELSLADLEKAGIKAKFEDGEDKTELLVSADNLIFNLSLSKELRPEYERIMFDESEQWITDSKIEVLSVPKELLN